MDTNIWSGFRLKIKRRCKAGQKWHVDPTYIKISGNWYYLYCAIDKSGKLIDVYLSDTRNEQAAKKFFSNCKETTGIIPDQITTDKEKAFSAAIANSLGKKVKHRTSKYKNNIMEQNHRGIKSR